MTRPETYLSSCSIMSTKTRMGALLCKRRKEPSLNLLVLKTLPENLVKVRDFYSGFGLNFREEKHGSGPYHWSVMMGRLCFELYPLAKGSVDSTTMVGLEVDFKRFELLRKAGAAKRLQEDKYGRTLIYQDPDGRSVWVTERKG